MTHPLTSFSGYIVYLKFTAGSSKGATKIGDVFNDPFRLGDYSKNYTGSEVVDTWEGEAADTFRPMWTPVVKGAFTNPTDRKKYDLKIIAKADGQTYYLNLGEDGTATNVPVGRIGYVY